MAYIQPQTYVRLIYDCHIDKDYNNTIYFATLEEQDTYFDGLNSSKALEFTAQTFQRYAKNSIRLQMPAGNVYGDFLGYNYMYFRNGNDYGNKRFYAFIDDVTYINDATVEVTYTIDVMQTWYFDYTLENCFVEREHTLTDEIGDNLIPEPLGVSYFINNSELHNEYNFPVKFNDNGVIRYHYFISILYAPEVTYQSSQQYSDHDRYVMKSIIDIGDYEYGDHSIEVAWGSSTTNPNEYGTHFISGGVPSGYCTLTFEIKPTTTLTLSMIEEVFNTVLQIINAESRANILSIICIPNMLSTTGWESITVKDTLLSTVYGTIKFTTKLPVPDNNTVNVIHQPKKFTQVFDKSISTGEIYRSKSYTPKNNKLYTSPYNYVIVSNKRGQTVKLFWEKSNIDWQYNLNVNTKRRIELHIDKVLSPTVEISLYPAYYNEYIKNVENSVSITDLPTGTWDGDSYSVWKNENQSALNMRLVGNVISGVTNSVASIASKNVNGGVRNATGVFNSIVDYQASVTQAQDKGDTFGGGLTTPSILWRLDDVGFVVDNVIITPDNAEMIDNFFSMFGYAIKQVKTPNIKNSTVAARLRPSWNYIKTNGCIIHSNTTDSKGLPAGEEAKISAIYDKGITFWNKNKTVGDYSQDNSPVAVS